MSPCRIVLLSVVLVILCSVRDSIECATGQDVDGHDHNNNDNNNIEMERASVKMNGPSDDEDDDDSEMDDDDDNDRRDNDNDDRGDDDNDDDDNDNDDLIKRMNIEKVKQMLDLDYEQEEPEEPEDPEEEEEEELDIEELAEGEVSAERVAPARYDGAQVWRIHTENVSSEEVIKLFESRYDGSVWKAKDNYVDVFLERSRVDEARRALRDFDLPYDVAINNVQAMIDHERRRSNRKRNKRTKRQASRQQFTWDNYYDLAEIYGYMRTLAQKYPTICKIMNIGKTVEGRGILVMRVAGPQSSRIIWVDGGIHAREWISPSSVMYIMDQFVRYWGKQPAHIRSAAWYFLPVMNPDGYQYSRSTDRLWRKNRRNFGACQGVDLNRNFDFKWTGVGASNDPCDMTYRGPKGLSEPETRAVAQYLQNLGRRPVAYITLHSYGQYILYPWGFASAIPSDHRVLKKTGIDAAESARLIDGSLYTVAPAFQPFGAAAGGSDDWAKGHLKVKYVYTVELRDKGRFGFLLPTDMIRVTCREALTIVGVISKASVSVVQ